MAVDPGRSLRVRNQWSGRITTNRSTKPGLFTTVLQQRISVFHIAIFGALLACVSLVASAFSPNIVWMSVLVGGAYGAGAGIVLLTFSIYTLTYFEKYRATATAVKYIGWAASGVLGPSLFAYVSENYGTLRGLMVVGAIGGHAIPLVMLLENPRPVTFRFPWRKKSFPAKEEHSRPSNIRDCSNAVLPSPSLLSDEAPTRIHGRHDTGSLQKTRGPLNTESSKSDDLTGPRTEGVQAGLQDLSEKRRHKSISLVVTNREQCDGDGHQTKYLVVKAPDMLKHCIALFRSARMYALVASYVAIDYSSSMHEGTIVAYGMDKKAGTLSQCNQLQAFAAVGQLVGRLVVPFVSDKIPFSRCPLAAGSLAISAASLVLISLICDYVVLSVLTTVLGVCRGFLICVKGVLYGEYLGVESLGLACGVQGLVMAPVVLSGPAAIDFFCFLSPIFYFTGLFRDKLGSYDQLYWVLAALNLVAACIVSSIALTDRQRRKMWSLKLEKNKEKR
ncbi:hypothetical protein V5799_027415 [Amblyomma americanum]|uniref:Monocarboxylate transporter n=1 Tax=Amblyomma americanum TaxID=6943 RepID=A0AAQ4DFT0_AMBAM